MLRPSEPAAGTPARERRRYVVVALGALTVVAAFLRFYRLDGRSLWLDEIFQAEAARLATPAQVVGLVQSYLDQMPLFFLMTWALGHWGDSAFILRLPSAIAGTLTVVAVFLLGRQLFGLRYTIAAGLLMCVMAYGLWYAQEARDYALLMLLTTVQMHLAYLVVRKGRVRDWAGLTLVTVLNLYNHYLALLVVAALGVYIGGFAFAHVFRLASTRSRIAMLAAVAVVAVAAAAVHWRRVLHSVYGSAANAFGQHPARAAASAAAVLAIAACAVFFIDRRFRARGRYLGELRQLELAAACALVVAVAYLPWLPSLRAFLSAPNLGFARVHTANAEHWAQALTIAERLGWSGPLLAALGVGGIALGWWTFGGRAAQSLLLLAWLVLPIAMLTVSGGWSVLNIDIRYLAFLFPALTMVGAAGVEGIASGIEWLGGRYRAPTRIAGAAAAAVLLAVLLGATLPATASSYAIAKDDWRGAAEHIAAASPAGATVISVGDYSDWGVICLDYYFHELRAPIQVLDGTQLSSDAVQSLQRSGGAVWGVLNHPSDEQLALLSQGGDERTDFVDVTHTIYAVRATDSALPPLEQARRLLRWESALQQALTAPAAMVELAAGARSVGPNLMPAPSTAPNSGWSYSSGATARDGLITLDAAQADASWTAHDLSSVDVYLLAFDHRRTGGWQSVYATALDPSGKPILAFPGGAGFSCAASADWSHSYFAFQLPAGSTAVTIDFRAGSTSDAEFQSLELTQIP